MVVLTNKKQDKIESIVASNPGKIIGKHSMPLSFFQQGYFFDDSHRAMIAKLREEGCDIVIFEVSDYKTFIKHQDPTYVRNHVLPDISEILEDIENNFDLDYLIFTTDVETNEYPAYDGTEAQDIYDILDAENYKNIYSMTDEEYTALKKYCVMTRPPMTYQENIINLYYDAPSCYYYRAFIHYIEKYLGRTAVLLPVVFDETGIPLLGDLSVVEHYSEAFNSDLREFSLFVNGLSDDDFKSIVVPEVKAIELGGTMTSRTVNLTDSTLVELTFVGNQGIKMILIREIYNI